MDGFTVFPVDQEADPEGSELQESLSVYFAYERMRFIRGELVSLLAAISVGVFVAAAWPGLLPPEWRFGVEAFWALCFLCTLGTVVAEWRCYRRWHNRRGHGTE